METNKLELELECTCIGKLIGAPGMGAVKL